MLRDALYVLRTFMFFFFFNDTATTEIYTLSLHDALPILKPVGTCASFAAAPVSAAMARSSTRRSEEHTSELQSQSNLVCRLLLEKKKNPRQRTSRARPPRADVVSAACHVVCQTAELHTSL